MIRRFAALFALLLLWLAPARAAEPEIELVKCVEPEPEELSWAEQKLDAVDKVFGDIVVAPLGAVMFFDLAFWDDPDLALGDGVGKKVDQVTRAADGKLVGGEVITGYIEPPTPLPALAPDEKPTWGYTYQRLCEAPVSELVPHITKPLERTVGKLQVRITGSKDGQLLATVPAQDLDLVALGLRQREAPIAPDAPDAADEPAEDPQPDPQADVRTIDTLAPFPVQVDWVNERTIETQVQLDLSTVPLVAGMTVEHQGVVVDLLGTDGDIADLRVADQRFDPSALANSEQLNLPVVVVWLVFGAVFFTLRMMFVNVRMFAHAIMVTTGRYDDPDDPGEISHFQALASALSATVGLGNIAGVAIAVNVGGPGAIFWMIVAGALGMSSKFTECTLGQMYRDVGPDGTVMGGPMRYLDKGLAEDGKPGLGKALAVIFALMCIGGSFGGGNMFQANQSYAAVKDVIPLFDGNAWLYGILLAGCVGLVIIGGIQRIGTATSFIVPIMCGVYLLAGSYILVVHAADVPAAFGTIIESAFSPEAGYGGMIGVLIQGFRRAAFSNEAGVGSAAIAHSAAATKEPVREGIVALLEPFIDTIMVCTMTGLVVVVTGVYTQQTGGAGVELTARAFGSVIEWFPIVLSFAVVMFAFSTMISWSYYGERCTTWLLGEAAVLPYRIVFLFFVFFGSVFKLGNVLDFSDLMVLGMAFPNILGALLLSGKVKAALDDYTAKLHAGEFKTHG